MGKTQSKRSVDITTEGKKGAEDEVTGKLEKIEDIDQKQLNGDATPQENNDTEKKDSDESENDKDLTTEKSAVAEAAQGSGDANGDQKKTIDNTTAGAATPTGQTSAKETDSVIISATNEGAAATAAADAAEDISPLSDESIKKSKKEKVKKKWSFRSISFGKKDKQKPAKTEETTVEGANAASAATTATTAATTATNGEAAVTAEENGNEVGITEEASKKEEGAGGDTAAQAAPLQQQATKLENGDATEKELNGQKTPTTTPTEDKLAVDEIIAAPAATNNETTNNTTAAAVADITTTTTTTTAADTTTISSVNDHSTISNENTAIDNIQTEQQLTKIAAGTVSVETVESSSTSSAAAFTSTTTATIVSNGPDEVEKKNGELNANHDNLVAAAEVVEIVNNKSIPSVTQYAASFDGGEKPHQNGTTVDVDDDDEVGVEAEQQQITTTITKSQIEVKNNNMQDNIDTLPCPPSPPPSPQFCADYLLDSSHSATVTAITANFVVGDDQAKNNSIGNLTNKIEQILIDEAAESIVATATVAAADVSDYDQHNNKSLKDECGVEKSAMSADTPQQPPPLPISPPPSQVSVFAFHHDSTENVASDEEMPSANMETPTTNIQVVVSVEPTSLVQHAEMKVEEATTESLAHTTLSLNQNVEHRDESTTEENIIADDKKTDETFLVVDAVKSDEFLAATAMIDEITEIASAYVEHKQQKDELNDQKDQEQQLQTATTTTSRLDDEEEFLQMPKTVEEDEKDDERISLDDTQTTIFFANDHAAEYDKECNGNYMNENKTGSALPTAKKEEINTNANITTIITNITTSGINDKNIDLPHASQSNSNLKDKEEECCNSSNQIKATIDNQNNGSGNNNEGNNDDDDALLSQQEQQQHWISSSKEIANATDLKENAAADIITQDLPVTCE